MDSTPRLNAKNKAGAIIRWRIKLSELGGADLATPAMSETETGVSLAGDWMSNLKHFEDFLETESLIYFSVLPQI